MSVSVFIHNSLAYVFFVNGHAPAFRNTTTVVNTHCEHAERVNNSLFCDKTHSHKVLLSNYQTPYVPAPVCHFYENITDNVTSPAALFGINVIVVIQSKSSNFVAWLK